LPPPPGGLRPGSLGEIDPAAVGPETLAAHFYLPEMPDPDLVIRSSGERRISNFLLWQSAYAGYAFPETLWPTSTGMPSPPA